MVASFARSSRWYCVLLMTAQKFNFSAAFDCVHSACTNEFNDVHQMAYTVHNSDCDAQIVQFSSFWHGNIEPNLWGQMRRSFRANKWAQSCPCDWVDRQRSRFSSFFFNMDEQNLGIGRILFTFIEFRYWFCYPLASRITAEVNGVCQWECNKSNIKRE